MDMSKVMVNVTCDAFYLKLLYNQPVSHHKISIFSHANQIHLWTTTIIQSGTICCLVRMENNTPKWTSTSCSMLL